MVSEMFRRFLIFLTLLAMALVVVPTGAAAGAPPSGGSVQLSPLVVLHGDTEFDDQERRIIEAAADVWRLQTGGAARVSIVWDLDFTSVADIKAHVEAGHNALIRTMSWAPDVWTLDEPNAIVLAFVYPHGGIHNKEHAPVVMKLVMDRLDKSPERMIRVVTHELGHVFGVAHLGEPGDVMFPTHTDGKPMCLSRNDLEAFCKLNKCNKKALRTCGR